MNRRHFMEVLTALAATAASRKSLANVKLSKRLSIGSAALKFSRGDAISYSADARSGLSKLTVSFVDYKKGIIEVTAS